MKCVSVFCDVPCNTIISFFRCLNLYFYLCATHQFIEDIFFPTWKTLEAWRLFALLSQHSIFIIFRMWSHPQLGGFKYDKALASDKKYGIFVCSPFFRFSVALMWVHSVGSWCFLLVAGNRESILCALCWTLLQIFSRFRWLPVFWLVGAGAAEEGLAQRAIHAEPPSVSVQTTASLICGMTHISEEYFSIFFGAGLR